MKLVHLIAASLLVLISNAHAQYNWKIRNSGTSETFTSVKFSAGKFFAANGGLFQSVNGESWSQVALSPQEYKDIKTITPVAGGVLAVSSNYYWPPTRIRVDLLASAIGAYSPDSAYLKGVAVVTGLYTSRSVIGLYRDSDAKITLVSALPWNDQPKWVIATEDEFLIGMASGMYASPDGLAWTLRSRTGAYDRPFYINGVFMTKDQFSNDKGATWNSWPDGWRPVPRTYGAGLYLAIKNGGLIMTSPDGEVWTDRESGTTDYLNSIAFGNSTFVAVGFMGRIITSSLPNPFPAPPAPQVTVTPSITLKWTSTAGLYYQPQSSTDLKNWMNFGASIPGSGLEMSRSFEATQARRYFRLVVE